ncbi:MAG: hypothetical protein PF488_02085 [Patescibacteria group bacterium]|jgi:hypothetical protein|nr:hypothetical protein [Patescibacteria group bacterium]
MQDSRKKRNINPKKDKKSGLASFIERPIPEENEVDDFERVIHRELRDKEIDTHLHDVYTDKKGRRINVSQFDVKKKPNIFLLILKRLFFIGIIVVAAYFGYNYFFQESGDISSLQLEITAPEKVNIGEEFSYKIKYNNPTKYVFSDIELEMQYPDNFIFKGAEVDPIRGNHGFELPDLEPGETNTVSIIGMIINETDGVNLAISKLEYKPGSFSSHFKKEDSISILTGGFGYNFDIETAGAIFVNQENKLSLIFSEKENEEFSSQMSDFKIRFEFSDNIDIDLDVSTSSEEEVEEGELKVEKIDSRSWKLSGLNQEVINEKIEFDYRVKEEVDDFSVSVILEKTVSEKDYIFEQEKVKPDLVSSDLSLSLFLNGSKSDQAVGFSENLSYTLNYSNMGSKSYENVSIMAIIDSDLVDWDTLFMETEGEVSGNSIIWTKEELDKLAEIEPNEEGEINFSVKLKEYNNEMLMDDLQIRSIAQYNINDQELEEENSRSNEIISNVSSDFSFSEKIMYFSEDDIPVGSGPLPPESGETTTFRVYWDIENNINELRDVVSYYQLPDNVEYVGNSDTDLGSINYDPSSNQVIWNVGYMPLSSSNPSAHFDISLTPKTEDEGKILILSPGSTATAYDTVTKSTLIKETSSKTTQLEDDETASNNNSGLVK